MRQLKIIKQITGRESYSVDKYLQEISKIDVLKPEEEVELAHKAHLGDVNARKKLIMCNLRFVVSVAKQYQNYGLTLGDLINEGNLGLLKAVEFYDETKGFKFISYAVWWIRQAILQAIAENARLIRLPLNKINMLNKLTRCVCALEQKCQREPTAEELATQMNLSPSEIKEYLKISAKPLSMDAPLIQEDNAVALGDVYVPTESNVPTPDNFVNRDSLKKDLKRSFVVLTEREIEILAMYYGLDDYNPMSLEEIGRELGLTAERVRQLKAKALKKLKDLKNTVWLKTYL